MLDRKELLEPMETLAIPGCQFSTAVFVSDATVDVLAAIDWTNGLACREEMGSLWLWVEKALERMKDVLQMGSWPLAGRFRVQGWRPAEWGGHRLWWRQQGGLQLGSEPGERYESRKVVDPGA